MTGASLERRLTNDSRETLIGACVDRWAPEHTREAAELMAAHRDARDPLVRILIWQRAAGLATRPYRRQS